MGCILSYFRNQEVKPELEIPRLYGDPPPATEGFYYFHKKSPVMHVTNYSI